MTVTAPETRTAPTPTRAALTANDRCDRCGAQAYVALNIPHKGGAATTTLSTEVPASSEAELLFCAHHNGEHGPALLMQGARVILDETHKLAPTNRQQGVSY